MKNYSNKKNRKRKKVLKTYTARERYSIWIMSIANIRRINLIYIYKLACNKQSYTFAVHFANIHHRISFVYFAVYGVSFSPSFGILFISESFSSIFPFIFFLLDSLITSTDRYLFWFFCCVYFDLKLVNFLDFLWELSTTNRNRRE